MALQPPRFAVRSAVIRDIGISPGARILYMYLDDETRDHWRLYEKQLRMAVTLGITTRQLRTQIGELARAGYVSVRQTMNGNVYDLDRKKTSAPDRKKTSDRSGRKLPILPLDQESQEPPTPLRENCLECGGAGLVRKTYRGQGVVERCGCTRERRSA